MRKRNIGSMIRPAREKLGLTRVEAAKKVGISAAYIGHLERSDLVILSEPLATRLIKKLKVPRAILTIREAHNRRASRWYAAYRARRA